MRSLLLIVGLFGLLSAACKLEAFSNQANANANSNQTPISTPAQSNPESKCSLTLAGSPTFNGFRLGMTPQEALSVFPQAKDDPEVHAMIAQPASQFGVSELAIIPAKYAPKDQVPAIKRIALIFLDGHISTLNVAFNGPQYAHVDKFVEKVIAETSLPTLPDWEAYVGMEDQLKTLTCKEFEVRVFAGGPGGNLNYVLVKDMVADKKLKDRRAKAQSEASPTPGK